MSLFLFQTWSSTLLGVSHDCQFLNSVVTDFLYLFSKEIELYRGDYERFIKTRSERLLNQQKEYDAQKQYREHVQVRANERWNSKIAVTSQTCEPDTEMCAQFLPFAGLYRQVPVQR